MDKHQVKIKINGQEKSFSSKKNKKKKTVAPKILEPEWNDFPESDLPLIITDETAAAADKKEEEEFEWVLPKEPEIPVTSKKPSYIEDLRNMSKNKSTKKKQSTPIKKKKWKPSSFPKQLLLAIVMAVGVGTCLGLLILAIMNVSNKPLTPNQPVTGQITEDPNGDNAENPGTTGGEQSVVLEAHEVVVLQAGAYSNLDTANAEIQQLQGAGYSAVSLESELFFVFMAVGPSLDGMKDLGKKAAEKGIEQPFAKAFTLPEKTFQSATAQDVLILQEGHGLYKELIAASANLLQGGAIDSAVVERMNAHHEKMVAVKEESISDEPRQWKDLLVAAYQNIQDFQNSNDTAKLWNAQQKLLEAIAFLY